MKKNIYYSLIPVLLFLSSCKEKYIPPAIEANLNYLVVDGSLVNGADSTIIRLSRTKKLDENPANTGEQNAQMTVEDEGGNTVYYFQQLDNNGRYAIPGMTLDGNKKYKLRINTTDGKQYLSDDILVKESPPIDSISWRLTNEGVTFYVNTHDPVSSTKYYLWQYAETYDYYSSYYSTLKYVGGSTTDFNKMFEERSLEEQIYHCWKTNPSSEILIGSTASLSEDRVSMKSVRFIPKASVEINSIYSILVKQNAISKEAFEYLENIKRINEQSGSLFDSQPSQIQGNIHCISNPEESVIGYLFASTLQQKRIFVTNQEVKPWGYSEYCPPLQTVPLILDSIIYYFAGSSPLLIPKDKTVPLFTGVIAGLPACTDCLTKKGTNIKPDFWP